MTAKNKWGFPLTECRRCGGSGHHSFNLMHGTTCYGCGGTGWVIAKKAKKVYGEFKTLLKERTQPSTRMLAIGDKVRLQTEKEYRVVASIEKTDEVSGWFKYGEKRTDYYWMIVTFEDGTTEKVSETLVWRRHTLVSELGIESFLERIPS